MRPYAHDGRGDAVGHAGARGRRPEGGRSPAAAGSEAGGEV